MDRDVQHLVLEDDDPECLAQRLLQERMVGGRNVGRILTELLPTLDVRMHRLALNRPRPHERNLNRDVVEVLGPRAQYRLHLRSAFDLEAADGVRALDLFEDVGIVERHARQIDLLAASARDEIDALLDGREHSQAEQVDLEEAGVRARVLVPLAHLPACHRRRLHRHELDERTRRDHHPAGMLGDVAREPADLPAQLRERAPARREQAPLSLGERGDLVADSIRIPVGELREPFELAERKAERLADVADRATRVVRREARDERRVLAPVLLGDADDELLANIPREVQVDVGNRRELAVEEASERKIRRHRIDVREAGEIADERADGRAAAAARRQHVAHRAGAAHLPCHMRTSSSSKRFRTWACSRRLLVEYRSAKARSQTRRNCTLAGSAPSEKSG